MVTKKSQDGYHTFRDSPCLHCQHLTQTGEQFNEDGWTCRAFPEQIPYHIWRYGKHDETLPGQVGNFTFGSKTYPRETGKRVRYDSEGNQHVVND